MDKTSDGNALETLGKEPRDTHGDSDRHFNAQRFQPAA
jgi:hypothetical protein